ncbi:MAG: pyridoxal phosphate-dependent aminotransferase [Leptospirillia bacterium]
MSPATLEWLREDLTETGRPRTLTEISPPLLRLDRLEPWAPLSPQFLRRMGRTFATLSLNRYPDSESRELKKSLGKHFRVEPDHILLGKGSDELLEILFLTVSGPILLMEPSFPMYRNLAQLTGRPVLTVPLERDLSLPVDRLIERIRQHTPALVVLSHPNNPTGEALAPRDIERIAGLSPGGVLIDEAYAPFAQRSYLSLLERFPNLMVLRSLSKLGLAAIRLGWLAASPEILFRLDKARLPFNVDGLLQSAGGLLCREALPALESRARRTASRRETLFAAMCRIPGIRPFPSQANFILFRIDSKPSGEVDAGLRSFGIAVRDMSPDHPLLENCLRVTVGEKDELRRFLEALSSIMKGPA